MPSRSWSEACGWVRWVVRILGFCIFVVAFFLPAVRAGAAGPGAIVFPGWKCASVALSDTFALFGKSVTGPPPLGAFLVAMSGWINPLILLLLSFSFSRRLLILRRVVGAFILACMAATWTFFVLEKLTPLVGHVLWIAGALLIIVPGVVSPMRKPSGGALSSEP